MEGVRRDRLRPLIDRLERARQGFGSTVVLDGDAGCGRSWICERLASTPPPWIVRYGRAPRLDTGGWLEATATATPASPMLFVVDDADRAAATAGHDLAILAESTVNRAVVLVLAARRIGGLPVDHRAHDRIRVPPLGIEDLHALVVEATGLEPDPITVRRIAVISGGNATIAAEIVDVLDARTIRTGAGLEQRILDRLPSTRTARERIRSLPRDTQLALCVAAIGQIESTMTIGRAIERLGLGLEDLAAAEVDGWIEVDHEHVTFTHPLERIAASTVVPYTWRRRAADALAAVIAEHDPLAAAWYESADRIEPDDALAARLDELARRTRREGDPWTASAMWQRAAAIATSSASAHVLAAADAALAAGRLDDAAELAANVLDDAADPSDRAEAWRIQGLVTTWRGRPGDAWSAMHDEAERIAEDRPGDAAALLLQATVAALHHGRFDVAIHLTDRASDVARGPDPMAMAARAASGYARSLVGDPSGLDRVLAASQLHLAVEPLVDRVPAMLHLTSWVGRMLDESGAPAEAWAMLGWTIERAHRLGADGLEVMPRLHRAAASLRRGRVADSAGDVAVADALVATTGQHEHRNTTDAAAARVAALRGDPGAIDRLRIVADRSSGPVRLEALVAAGSAALSFDRPLDAVDALVEADARCRSTSFDHPALAPYQVDLVEALILADRRSDAEEIATAHARSVAAWPDPLVQGLAARGLGLVAVDDDEAEHHFERSADALEFADNRLEWARTRRCHGERRRRRRRRGAARPLLEDAVAAFTELGAMAWAERARAELAVASSLTLPGRSSALLDQRPFVSLTERERQIATVVAEGATNREIGARLHLSPKTVENQLSRIYAKLGVRSRTELAGLVHAVGLEDQR